MSTLIDEAALRNDLRPFVVEALAWFENETPDEALVTRVTDRVVHSIIHPVNKVIYPNFKILPTGQQRPDLPLEDKAAMRTYLMWEVANSFAW
jgi:hypothetical protein